MFYSYRSANRDVWVMPAGGGPARQLTNHPALEQMPNWSPDGREIAFQTGRSGNRDIWTIPAGGGEERQITSDPANDDNPTYSPDGTYIVFQSDRDGVRRLWKVSTEGGSRKDSTSLGRALLKLLRDSVAMALALVEDQEDIEDERFERQQGFRLRHGCGSGPVNG